MRVAPLRQTLPLDDAASPLPDGTGWAGLSGDALAAAVAVAGRRWGRLLVVVDGPDRVERLLRGLRFFGADLPTYPFPADDTRPYGGFAPDPELARARTLALARVASGRAAVVVTTAAALACRVPSPEVREAGTVHVRAGDRLDRDVLVGALAASGHLLAGRADAPGRVAVRGDVVDAWPVGGSGPVRIDFFDDEVESVRRLDAVSLQPTARMKRALFLPAREERLDAGALARLASVTSDAVGVQDRGVRLRRRMLEDLGAGVRASGIGDWLPALVPVADPLPLLSSDMRRVVVHPDAVVAAVRDIVRLAHARWSELSDEDRPLVEPSDRWARTADVEAGLRGALPVWSVAAEGPCVDFGAEPVDGLAVRGGELGPVLRRMRDLVDEGYAVTLVVDGPRRAEHLRALLLPHGLDPPTCEGPYGVPRGALGIVAGDLPAGFVAPASLRAYVSVAALFGARAPARLARASPRDVDGTDVSRLKLGDRVVHRVHGIGEYRGLQRLGVDGVEQDFARVVYRDGDLLFVPVHALDQLAPWQGPSDADVPLDRLGGVTWAARKAKVRDRLLGAADEIVRTHALRSAATRELRPPPGRLYRAVEASFPYDETPDQAAAIEAVLADLSGSRPMDRLLCGDVGFGKTEVALRATARVVECGGQVAVLCPTTVLVHQHVRTFRERLGVHGVRVAHLSRFLSSREETEVRAAAARGDVDVLVGTHGLLGRDARLPRLELAIVDEEHRFGVRQKAKLARLREAVDVLAMSATPIPRTLQMALTGVMEVSVIHTPPPDRLAVRTLVAELTETRVRDIVMAERGRGGQVFAIHNRVASLDEFANWVARAVPEARIGIAHGQMEASRLESVLVRFVERELDVLVCTSIVESGVDLPNVNSILVDGADSFGLAQLHQLRGRVGRGGVRATALFGVPETMTTDARRRLRVLEEHTGVGAGFHIAAADLEIRGGGNLLGVDQSGQVAEVGWETFVELLGEAVASARGMAEAERLEPEVEVAVPAFLPDALVPDVSERLGWYRRLSNGRTDAEVEGVLDELEREVGALPEPVRNLGGLIGTRIRCRALGIQRCVWLKVRVIFELHAGSPLHGRLGDVLAAHPRRFGLTAGPPAVVAVQFTPAEAEHPFRLIRWALARFAEAGGRDVR